MTPPSRLIRHATRADLPELIELYQHLIPGDERPSAETAAEVFDRFLVYKGSAILVCERDGALVSSCTLIVVPNLTRGGSPYGLIENVVTRRDARRRGFGRQVLDAASVAAWEAGCYKVMLMTGSGNPEAQKFYSDVGFDPSKTGFQKRRIASRPKS